MYLDQLPDLSRARLVRSRARGIAVREGDRAVAVAFVSDGTLMPAETLVRFELTRGEDPARRLADAMAATGTRAFWFYGGDAIARRAAVEADLQLRPAGAVFVHRAEPAHLAHVTFRPPSQRDLATLPELLRDHAPAFKTPQTQVVVIGPDPVGLVFTEPLDQLWTEVRVIVHASYRGQGFASSVFAATADRLEGTGRRVCAALEAIAGRERSALETAGFRASDYYFTATKR